MAVVVVAGQAVVVSDLAVEVKATQLRLYLETVHSRDAFLKLRRVRVLLRGSGWSPVERAALERVMEELEQEASG